MHRILVPLLFLVQIAQSQDFSLTTFPDRKIFHTFRADALAHQLSLSRVTNNRDWIGAIGGSLPLVQAHVPSVIQLSVGATVFNRIIKTPGHISVHTVDYRIDFPVDLRIDSFAVRAAYGHISSHYADDGIEQLGKTSISSVKDYVLAGLWWYTPVEAVKTYASIIFNYHNEPVIDKRWLVQCGVESTGWQVTNFASVYGAVDIKLKQEVGWGSTQSYQVGVSLFSRGPSSLRIAYTHRRGFDDRGQLFDQKETADLISLYIDL